MTPVTQLMKIACRGLVALALGFGSAAASVSAQEAHVAGESAPRVEVRGEWFYVDGEPFLIKGVGYSPYRPGQLPWKDKVDLKLVEQDFERITDAGFNTLRTWTPLSPEVLQLADRHGLMVMQGIWVERVGDYASSAFLEGIFRIIKTEVDRVREHQNILLFLVGNELLPDKVYRTGVAQTEVLLDRLVHVVKEKDARRFVSYANWPNLALLKVSSLDAVCFNLYPYAPSSIAHSFGYRGYAEHLKRNAAEMKPLIVTEVGLSVSPQQGNAVGYGGYTPDRQKTELVKLWDTVFQSGAQGGAIFEWNDEWWKHGDFPKDEEQHNPNDPEEWFGLIEFSDKDKTIGSPRPILEAIKQYNQAVVVSPVSGVSYDGSIPLSIYSTERVAAIRYHLGTIGRKTKMSQATQTNRHWWKASIEIDPKLAAGEQLLTVEALDDKRKTLTRLERPIIVRQAQPALTVTVQTDREIYEVGRDLETLRYTITVLDEAGKPLAGRPVRFAVSEPLSNTEVTNEKTTDEQGKIHGSYLIHDTGMVILSAATPLNPANPIRWIGDEVFIEVRRRVEMEHIPSIWEKGIPEEMKFWFNHQTPAFRLSDAGNERVIDYARYGTFNGPGTDIYSYVVTDWKGLAAAAGQGVYPNEAAILNDSAYQAALKSGRLEGDRWDFTWHKDVQLAFFKWSQADEEVGVKHFYTALMLERAGLWDQAVKAYYSVLVHFPTSVGWTAFNPPTPWYVGRVAYDKIQALLRLHTELGLRLEDAQVTIENSFDNHIENDRYIINPGRLVAVPAEQVNPPTVDFQQLAVKRTLGKGKVRLVQYENGHWQMIVEGKPWTIHGITYQPSAVGESPDEGTMKDWVQADRNGNGQLDVMESFLDVNRNNRQDADEPAVGDFELLKRMGVNTVRLFHTNHDAKKAKPVLRKLYQQHGLRFIIGDFVGMYTVGSGAKWEEGTNYLDPKQRKRMFEGVKKMVNDYKDEPYILMWVLGNENNFGGVEGIIGGFGNAGKYPKEYYGFLNELALWIKKVDPNHPVAVGNGDQGFLPVIAEAAPAIDIFGTNMYRGWHGFGRSMFEDIRKHVDRPVMLTEYGCPAFQKGGTPEEGERDQAIYHFGNWVDMADNMAGRGVGNSIGGIAFEWSDEWWKGGQPPRFSPKLHETAANWAGPYPGGWNYEEWYGVVSQGDGSRSPFLWQPRVSYRLYESMWKASGAPEAPKNPKEGAS